MTSTRSGVHPPIQAAPCAISPRLLCGVTGAAILVIALVYRLVEPNAQDPFWLRMLVGLLPLAFAAASFASERVKTRLPLLYRGALVCIVAWFTWASVLNGFTAADVPALYVVTLAATVAFGLGLKRFWPLAAFAGLTVALPAAALASVPVPAVPAAPVVGGLAVLAVLLVAVGRYWLRMKEHEAAPVVPVVPVVEPAEDYARELARLKESLLSNMSHEIRTPLTSMIGFADLLQEEIADEHRELVGYITRSGNRLLRTLSTIMDLAAVEAKAIAVQLEPVNLLDEIRGRLVGFEAQAHEKGLTLTCRAVGPPPAALIDRMSFERILDSILSNAIKFTQEGGVTVELQADSARVYVRIRDTGVGISEDFLPQIYEAFRQESDGLTRSFEGSGLGLTLAKQLADHMGAGIDVQSAKGQGTIVTITFERAPAKIDRPLRHVALDPRIAVSAERHADVGELAKTLVMGSASGDGAGEELRHTVTVGRS